MISRVRRPALLQELSRIGVLRMLVLGYALALLLYLPLETAILASLQGPLYWVLRLLPDLIVFALAAAVVLIGDRRARTLPVRALWVLAVICLVIFIANTIRGIVISDSVNAMRLVVRYLVLGLALWWAVEGEKSVARLVFLAIVTVGVVQVLAAVIQLGLRLAGAGGASAIRPATFLYLDGTLGRYDRLGLLIMSVVIAIIAFGGGARRGKVLLLACCMALLCLTTSRQAMVGLGVGCGLLVIFPGFDRWNRVLATTLAIVCVAFVVSTSGQLPPAPQQSADSELGPTTPVQSGSSASAPPPAPVSRRGGSQLSIDPTRNFRLYYNLVIMPWAALTEPLLGFGPRQQVAASPDPRLAARFASDDVPWDWARQYTNDSNYAELVVQFGIVVPLALVIAILVLALRCARIAVRTGDGFARLAVANCIAVLAAAWFGPALEIRPVSIVMWLTLAVAVAAFSGSDRRLRTVPL